MNDRSSPGVRISVLPSPKASSGMPLDLGGRLLSFSYEDSEEKADKVTLELDNYDLVLFEREELMGGATLEVSWGYPGLMAPARRVVVQRLRGFQKLTVEGHALSVLMNREAKTRRWEQTTRSNVVRDIGKEAGFEGLMLDVDDTDEVFEVISQVSETDACFLKSLGAKEHFVFYVDHQGLHWRKRPKDSAPSQVMTWVSDPGRGDIMAISVESNLVKRAGSVTVKSRDPMTRKTIEVTADKSKADRTALGDVVEVVNPETAGTELLKRNATQSVHPSSAPTPERAAKEAAARFMKAERDTIKLSMQVIGDPTLAAKTVVEVQGISSVLSGKYYVTEVKHSISSSGYTSDLKLRRDAQGGGMLGGAKQEGKKNTSEPATDGSPLEVEKIDKETGETHTEYVPRGQPIGASDPEGRNR